MTFLPIRRRSARCSLLGTALLMLVALGALADEPPVQPTTPPPVTITTKVEPRHVTVGTPFRYTMKVEAKGEVEVVVPILADRLGDFVIQDFGEVPHDKSKEGGMVVERWYTMVTYEAGDHLIPGAPVQYREPGTDLKRIDAPETLIIVDSLLPKNEEALAKASPRDIKGPVAVPRDYRPLWWGAAALLGAVALVFGLYQLINRRRRAQQVPSRPAHEIALEALARLRSAGLLEREQHEQYYIRLSAIVRTYLEGRFGLRAPEMTTEEFLQAAQRDRQLPPEHRPALSQFLSEADLVKFARYVPTADDTERAYKAARLFIESTALPAEGNLAAA